MSKLDIILQAHLFNGESLGPSIRGLFHSQRLGQSVKLRRKGILAATDQRIIFATHHRWKYSIEVILYTWISDIELTKTFLDYSLAFLVSGNPVVMKRIKNPDVKSFFYYIKKNTAPSNPPLGPFA